MPVQKEMTTQMKAEQNDLKYQPSETATNNSGQKYNGPEYWYQ